MQGVAKQNAAGRRRIYERPDQPTNENMKVDTARLMQQRRKLPGEVGGGVLPKKMGRVVPPASQNPYPIYE